MATDSLGAFNAAVSTLSAFAAAVAAWIAWKVHKKQGESDYPSVSASFDEHDRLFIRIENPTPVEWTIESLVLPKYASGFIAHKMPRRYDDGGSIIPPEPDAMPPFEKGTIAVNLTVSPAGTSHRLRSGPGDVLSFRAHLQSSRPKVSMRLILRSNDALQRIKAVPIKRTAPERIMIAKD